MVNQIGNEIKGPPNQSVLFIQVYTSEKKGFHT